MSTFDKLDDTFNIVPQDLDESDSKIVRMNSDSSQDIDSDYQYSRGQLYNLIEKGQEAINDILDVAKQTNHPRAYEVAGQLIKNVAEVTEKLGDLQEKMRRLKEVPNNAPKNVTNALFVGSTTELQKMLKDKIEDGSN
mgnify:CR=1 FL=1